jgi:hypothetical protein
MCTIPARCEIFQEKEFAVNARRAANLSPTKTANLITEEETLFRWSATAGKLYIYEGLNPDERRIAGEVCAEQADLILNATGWKPANTTSPFSDWAWYAFYRMYCWLRLPGFYEQAPANTVESVSPAQENHAP